MEIRHEWADLIGPETRRVRPWRQASNLRDFRYSLNMPKFTLLGPDASDSTIGVCLLLGLVLSIGKAIGRRLTPAEVITTLWLSTFQVRGRIQHRPSPGEAWSSEQASLT